MTLQDKSIDIEREEEEMKVESLFVWIKKGKREGENGEEVGRLTQCRCWVSTTPLCFVGAIVARR